MIYVMSYRNQVRYGKKWIDIGAFKTEGITENNTPRADDYQINTFEELKELAKDFYGLKNTTTRLRKECVEISYDLTCHEKITERKFQKHGAYQFRKVWKPFEATMQWLAENLPADVFMEYAKDRNWNAVVNVIVGE